MRILLLCFSLLSAAGLALSVLAHVAVLRRTGGPLGAYTPLLHAGLFVVWIPAVWVSRRRVRRNHSGQNGWQAIFRDCPAWLKYPAYALLAYAMANALMLFRALPAPDALPAQPSRQLHVLSAYWMAFYALALAVLYAATRSLASASGRGPRHS